MVYKSVVRSSSIVSNPCIGTCSSKLTVVINRNEGLQNVVISVKTNNEIVFYLAFENSVMFQMFQYFIKGIALKKLI